MIALETIVEAFLLRVVSGHSLLHVDCIKVITRNIRLHNSTKNYHSRHYSEVAVKLAFHDADTDTDILASADISDMRDFLKLFRHSCDDPREDVGEDVGVGVRFGVVECQLKATNDNLSLTDLIFAIYMYVEHP